MWDRCFGGYSPLAVAGVRKQEAND